MPRFDLAAFCLLVLTAACRADDMGDMKKAALEAEGAGDYRRARELLTTAHDNTERLDVTDVRRAEAKVELARLLLVLGEYARCEQLCTESIELVEKHFGENHQQIAKAEDILAGLYVQLGMSVLADQHCKRGMKICEGIHGREHPDVASFEALLRHIWNLRSGS